LGNGGGEKWKSLGGFGKKPADIRKTGKTRDILELGNIVGA